MNILIIGADGNLGGELQKTFLAKGHRVTCADRDDVDIADRESVQKFMHEKKCDAIVNAAAYNNVDNVETAEGYHLAYGVNAVGPGLLAEAATTMSAAFVHYSTDYVFAGTRPEGYREDDAPDPINKYGETKAWGEKAALAACAKTYICRLSKIFGPVGKGAHCKPSFVDIIMRLAQTKPELTLVDEEVGCPSYIKDIAEATERLLVEQFRPGIYHLVNEGLGVTWYGFAEEFLELLGNATPRKRVSSAEFPKPAKRPKFASLLNTKFPRLRPRIDALREFLLK